MFVYYASFLQLCITREIESTLIQVIIAGSKETVAKAVQKAARYRDDLLKRGVLVVPIVWGGDKEDPMLKKRGFGAVQKPTTSNAIPAGVCLSDHSKDSWFPSKF